MECKRDEHGRLIPQTDAYGNPIRTDEYGNPLPFNQGYGIGAGKEKHHRAAGLTGILHRSGSSSSSSVSTY